MVVVLAMLGPALSRADSAARSEPLQASFSGPATVVDGDSLELSGTEIRLFGIDAPEVGQYCERGDGVRWRCGHYSSVALDRSTVGKTVVCVGREKDSYGRIIAVCRVDGADLSAMQVRDGWAVAYRHYSNDYVGDEEAAKHRGVGVWQGKFEMPWRWRERMRRR